MTARGEVCLEKRLGSAIQLADRAKATQRLPLEAQNKSSDVAGGVRDVINVPIEDHRTPSSENDLIATEVTVAGAHGDGAERRASRPQSLHEPLRLVR